jgi:hypothetical protein
MTSYGSMNRKKQELKSKSLIIVAGVAFLAPYKEE